MNFLASWAQDYENPNSLAMKARRKRAEHVKRLIAEIYAEKGECRVIDLGGEPPYWRLFEREFLEAHRVHITLVNLAPVIVSDPLFSVIQGSACDLGHLADNSFDLVHSNSVIEHVGLFDQMEAFAREARRLAPRYFIQTPSYEFPFEPHFRRPFFHYLPERWRARWLMRFRPNARGDLGKAIKAIQSSRLLSKAEVRYLFPDSQVIAERVGGFLVKSWMVLRS